MPNKEVTMNKKLPEQISQQLEKLDNYLEKIRNFGVDLEEENWDADYYYGLAEKLEEVVTFLKQEKGLLENLEEWQEKRE